MSGEKTLSRRNFLKLAGAAALGPILSACAPQESSMTDEAITAEEMEKVFAEEAPEPSHLPLEDEQRRAEVDEAIKQNREIKKLIAEQASRRVELCPG